MRMVLPIVVLKVGAARHCYAMQGYHKPSCMQSAHISIFLLKRMHG